MPYMNHDGASIYYEEAGAGYPLLLFAPGSLMSSIDYWRRPSAWIDPTVELAKHFRVIALDLRNAGQSRAPITAQDDWDCYTRDHLALLDHLGIERCHLMGQCIGGPLIMGMLKTAPQRVSAAVLLQPSGRIGPIAARSPIWDEWCATLKDHPEATPEVLEHFYANMYTNDFVHTVSRDFVKTVRTPLLVLAGNDRAHPYAIAEELAALAPDAEFIAEWKEGAAKEAALKRIPEFLLEHTP